MICWDGDNASKSWRHDLCPDYKSNRKSSKDKPVPQEVKDIHKQIPILEKFFTNFGLTQFSVPKLEADDLIGVLATALRKTHHRVLIYSTDRDFYQLIHGNVMVVRDLDKSKKGLEFTAKEVKRDYGVLPKDWLRYRAFVGDKGDKIDKPIAGIGEKRVLELLARGVDASKSKPDPKWSDGQKLDLKQHWSKVRLAYHLSKIIRKHSDRKLPREVRSKLKNIVQNQLHNLYRKHKTKKRYRQMTQFFAKYDLEQLMENRHALWKIR